MSSNLIKIFNRQDVKEFKSKKNDLHNSHSSFNINVRYITATLVG